MNREAEIDAVAARTEFPGVVRVDVEPEVRFAKAYGDADRRHGIPNTVDTQLAMASGSKAFTALAVMSLIEDGTLALSTTARSILGADLPLIDDVVTVEHLLAHRSGIGDYLDENAGYELTDYVLRSPVHELATTEQFVVEVDGYPTKFSPGERFEYCNGGFIVLALLAERASGVPFHDLVQQRVFDPAGLRDTAYLRSDQLPGRAALGYVEVDSDVRTNVFHLPVRGSGDGGAYTTVADMASFWTALFAGKIVTSDSAHEMTRSHSDDADPKARYGLGFWLHKTRPIVTLAGSDAGVSFRSVRDPEVPLTYTVISNTSEGAWPVTRRLAELLGLT